MRKLHIKRLACLLVAVAVLGAGIHWLHGFQVQRNAGALLRQAQHAEEDGQLEQAADYLSRYLILVPDDGEAQAQYGLILDRLGEQTGRSKLRVKAFFILEGVLRRQPDRQDVRRRLVDLAMSPSLERFTDARTHLEVLLRANPENGELEFLLGRCAEGNREFARAAEWYARAIQHRPRMLEAYVRRANLLRRRLNQAETADQVLAAMIEANPSVEAYLARARYRREMGRLEEAADDLAQARAREPDHLEVLLESAELALQLALAADNQDEGRTRTQLAEARQYLQRGVQLDPLNARFYTAQARVELAAGNHAEALAALHRGLDVLPHDATLLWALAEALLDGENFEQIEQLIVRLRKEGVAPTQLNYLAARVLARKGKWLEAIAILKRTLPALERSPALEALAKHAALVLGQCYEAVGNLDLRYEAYRRALDLDPLWPPACLAAGATLTAMGKIDDALAMYQRIGRQVPAVRLTMVRLLIIHNLRLPADQRDWSEVERLLAQLAAAMPASGDVVLLRADVLTAQQQFNRAGELLVAARERNPRQMELWLALASLAERRGQPVQAWILLNEAEGRFGDCVAIRLARARQLAHREPPQPQPIKQLADHLNQFDRTQQEALLRGLAQLLLEAGELRTAEELWRDVAQRQPHDLSVQLTLFDLAMQAGDDEACGHVLQTIKDIEGPDGSLWRYGEACRLVRQVRKGDRDALARARLLLGEAETRRRSWCRIPALAGELYDLEGKSGLALPLYARAVELGNRNLSLVRRLVQLLYERKRFAEAEQVLRQLPEEVALSSEVRRLAAEVALQAHEPDRAIDEARKAVAADSRDYRDHLWLGKMLWNGRHQEEAEAALSRALELAPEKAEVWVALVTFLADSGRKELALAKLEEARKTLPRETAALALAQAYDVLGRRREAQEFYAVAVKAQPEDVAILRLAAEFYMRRGQLEDADPCLQKIASLQAVSSVDGRWARRLLLEIRAFKGNYQQALKALADLNLLEESTPGSGAAGDADMVRTRVVILLAQKSRRSRLDAIKLLEQLRDRDQLSQNDRFILAQLYDATGDWPSARALLLAGVTARQENPMILLQLARRFLTHGEASQAQRFLDQLEKLQPEALTTVTLKAQLLKAAGKETEAVQMLRTYAQGDGVPVGRVAAVLEEIQGPAAEDLYRQWVRQAAGPEAILVLAAYLSRQHRIQEALEIFDKAWQTCPVEVVATANVAMLYVVPLAAEQVDRLAQRLETAIDKNPRATVLRFQLANVRTFQGRYPEAVSLYRAVFAAASPSPELLNNLAWLLAMQGQGAEGLELLRRAAEMIGPVPELLDTRGVVELRLGRLDAALEDLQDAASDSSNPIIQYHLAQAYLATKNRSEALLALRRAQTFGLKAEIVHPLERKNYEQLLAELQ